MKPCGELIASLALVLASATIAGAEIQSPLVERLAADRLAVRWQSEDPVDVYISTRSNGAIRHAEPLTLADHGSAHELVNGQAGRVYFTLRDARDGALARVAERLLPLEHGSNFRDLGGYPAANGKHVRWGMIYRSGATPMLTDTDYRYVGQLGITSIVDLRSVEERQIAPDELATRIRALYLANSYPASDVFPKLDDKGKFVASPNGAGGYRTWLILLAPQYRALFQQLLKGQGAVNFHCSAGQDRSGVAAALVLSALGVPRQVIFQDYLLSTVDRRPEYEMPRIDVDRYPGNPVALFYASVQKNNASITANARPLLDKNGQPYLQQTFDEIDTRWGSANNYLSQVLGVDARAIAKLRSIYLQ